MAVLNLHILICLLLFIYSVPNCNAKKLGSSSFKGTKITQNTYKTKITVNKNYGYRPWGSGYNSWYTYGTYGHIYGFVWYTRTSTYRNNPNREPTICRNEFDNVMDNGTHYEWFICPSENLTSEYHYCCGDVDKEYCCRFVDNGWRVFGTTASVLAFFLFCCCCCCYCCCNFGRKEQPQPYFQRVFTQKFSTRRANTGGGYHFNSSTTPTPVTVTDPSEPQDPELSHLQPQYPPQPQPMPTYPPASTQPVPPAPGFIPQPVYPGQAPYMPQPTQPYPTQPSPSFPMPDPNFVVSYPPGPPPALNNNPILPPSYAPTAPSYQDTNLPYPTGPAPAGYNATPSAPPPPYKE